MNKELVVFKFWKYAYDVCYFLFGHMPITYDVKHKMNMAYMRWQLSRD